MSFSVALTSFATWTGGGVSVRGAPRPSAHRGLGAWPEAPSLSTIHPRARRPHPAATALVQLAHATVAGHALPEGTGVLLGTTAGCATADRDFEDSLHTRGSGLGSPSVFVYTLPSAALGEVSIALGLRGPQLTVSASTASALTAVAMAAAQIASGRLEVCLCGGIDVGATSGAPAFEGELPDEISLFLLERGPERGVALSTWASGYTGGPSPSGQPGGLGLAAALARGVPCEVETRDRHGFWARVALGSR